MLPDRAALIRSAAVARGSDRDPEGLPTAVARRRPVPIAVLLVACLAAAGIVDLTRGRPAAGAGAGVRLEVALPLPALPLGPGPLYPLDAWGPRSDDDAALRWSEQTLAAIRALKTGPTVNARALAVVHTAMYDA
jgi:hypothetical protein